LVLKNAQQAPDEKSITSNSRAREQKRADRALPWKTKLQREKHKKKISLEKESHKTSGRNSRGEKIRTAGEIKQ
jgi:hypothetical protein